MRLFLSLQKEVWLGLALVYAAWLPGAWGMSWRTGFDNAGSVAWLWNLPGYGAPQPEASWDPTQDAGQNTTSGSLKCVQEFTGKDFEYCSLPLLFLDPSNNPVVLDVSRFPYLTFDLKVSPDSGFSNYGNHGWLDLKFLSTNPTNPFAGGLTGPVEMSLAVTNWSRFAVPILPATPGLETVCGLQFSVYSSPGGVLLTNRLQFNVDNLELFALCCVQPAAFVLTSEGNPAEGYRLRWPRDWAGSALQFSSDLVHWQHTGLETNAAPSGDFLEVAVPSSIPQSPASGFWRLRISR